MGIVGISLCLSHNTHLFRHGTARRPTGRDRKQKHDGGTDPGAHYVFLSILLKEGVAN